MKKIVNILLSVTEPESRVDWKVWRGLPAAFYVVCAVLVAAVFLAGIFSGVILMEALLFALSALDLSVVSEESYALVSKYLSHPISKLCVCGAAWVVFHNLCWEIRLLLLNFHAGAELAAARFSAVAAFATSILMTIIFGVWLW